MSDTDDPVENDGPSLADMANELEEMQQRPDDSARDEGGNDDKNAADLEAVFDVPVRISAVLGRTRMPVAKLLQMDTGTIVELDRQVGEAIDIYVNDRLVARGEIVLVENKLGITMTEIIKAN
ncbi:flagellar motor switch protein FliN [Maritalea mediterranea]|uniref:flagellar motor switch protein FliN n=1 Tax=Maritalea mediterranea TaxID=2909667 RepID=UPI003F72F995